MKLKTIGILIIGILILSNCKNADKKISEINEKHYSTDKNFILISDSISPNGKYKYYEYQFDNGGIGYSRVSWSVSENNGIGKNLFNGKIPDGYKTKGWTKNNELILENGNHIIIKTKTWNLIMARNSTE